MDKTALDAERAAAAADIPQRRQRRLSPTDRRAQLIDAAETAFAEVGTAITMDEIAERAGVTKPVLYAHFDSKNELVAACIKAAREQLFDVTSQAAKSAGSTEEVVWLTMRTYFGFVGTKARAWSILNAQGALHDSVARQQLQAMREAQSKISAQMIHLALPDVDKHRARLFTEAIDGACERVALWLQTQPDADLDTICDELTSILWNGIGAANKPRTWSRTGSEPG